ncbi:MAG: ABC transporter permease [Acholeplasmataceae bacterium]|nr:ABC transporter permease [Acholeplasmataceae bacterium]
MNRFLILVKGELARFNKYNVTTVSVLITIVWFLLLFFIDDLDILSTMLPFILVVDATMMSVIFVGSVMFFEKSESTVSTMLVTPVTNRELILSKAVANTIHTFISSLAIVLVFHFVKNVEINWFLISFALLIGIFWHSLLGFVFSYHSKDFTTMLVNVMFYNFLITIPAALNFFNVVFKGEVWEHVLIILPTQATIKLIMAGFNQPIEWAYWLSLAFMLISGILGTLYYVFPKFKEYAVRQSGV